MSYYLKKTKLKGRTYLSIDESFYSRKKKGTAHRVYRSLGSIETLMEKGMDDPVSFYRNEVNELNRQATARSSRRIGDFPDRFLGYFPLKSIMEKLDIPQFVKYFNIINDLEYDLYDVLSSLVFAFSVCPYSSRRRSFHDVVPCLLVPPDSADGQIEKGLSFLGNNFEKIVELFARGVRQHYPQSTGNLYYSSMDLYFETEPETDPSRKRALNESCGPLSVGIRLLLDEAQIPAGMKMTCGEKNGDPLSREAVSALKERFGVSGRTVRVADNVLDCAESIFRAVENGQGYMFSRSVKSLTREERDRVIAKSADWHKVKDRNGALVYLFRSRTGVFPYTFVQKDGTVKTFSVEEKRVLTWRPGLARRQRAEIDRLVEKARACAAVMADMSEYGDAIRYVRFLPAAGTDGTAGEFYAAQLDEEAIERDRALAGFRLFVTSERKMSSRNICEILHNERNIEETFRIMKSDIDSRPGQSRNTEAVLGHFLVCYIAVLLERLFQHCELGDVFSNREIFDFMRYYRVIKGDGDYYNITPGSGFITQFSERSKLPLDHMILTEKQIKKIISFRF